MKGSTLVAMSEAVDHSEVILYGVSTKYKESGNCRLEANYAYQLGIEMVPLMMEASYKARGWLGMLLGTRMWYSFVDAEQDDDAAFEKRIDSLLREVGNRGLQQQQQQQQQPNLLSAATNTPAAELDATVGSGISSEEGEPPLGSAFPGGPAGRVTNGRATIVTSRKALAVPPRRVDRATNEQGNAVETPARRGQLLMASASRTPDYSPSVAAPSPATSSGAAAVAMTTVASSPGGADTGALIQLTAMMLEEVKAGRDEAKAELNQLREQMAERSKEEKREVISAEQVVALQTRLEGMHAAELLSVSQIRCCIVFSVSCSCNRLIPCMAPCA